MLETILSAVGLVLLYFVSEFIGEVLFEHIESIPFVRAFRSYVSKHTWPTIAAWVGYALLVWIIWPLLKTSAVAVFLFIFGGVIPVLITMLRVRGRRLGSNSLPTVPNKR